MIQIKDREQELANNEEFKEQGIPREWELLSAKFNKKKKEELFNLLQWTKGVSFGYTNVASNSEYSKTGVKRLYSDKRFRGVIADFKHLKNAHHITNETIEKIINIIGAIRSIEEKYRSKILSTLTANNKENSHKKDPLQLKLNFEEDPATGKTENSKKSSKRSEELDELYDDTDIKYEHHWQEYNNK